jgi:hypothetical protein
MAVNGISQPQVAPPDSTFDLASQRAQHAGSKANTAQATGVSPAQQAEETKAAATAQDNAGRGTRWRSEERWPGWPR